YQNVPNPFTHNTRVGFELPNDSEITLTITDVKGQVLKVISGAYSKGYHEIQLRKSDLPSTGVLQYRLETDKASATRTMILMH
ncbi:MAG: T9SS type A sorting domain-containing protein, partial [Phaeodactylibacter sp.]|nr:T9SS type A sorting domain-containing protein [Phaeodactylibacter sp.]